jgi:S-adenosyl methyltransferase
MDGPRPRFLCYAPVYSPRGFQRPHRKQFFDGLELIEPGVVPVQQWRPASDFGTRAKSTMRGGVARR